MVVVELGTSAARRLPELLGPDFAVTEEDLLESVRSRRSSSFYFLPFVTKVDLFIRGDSDFDRSEMQRRQRMEARPGRFLWLKTPEDTVLRKLLWFRAGGELSTTQWRDVVAVLRVSGPEMDPAYLDRWADELGIAGLLARARSDAAPRTIE